ncbi:MAG: 2-hydroxyacid dehydrogenase [Chlorobi bacterium]|nr:2-hydroxyacid dehydrogenase [Chlorobiota bacterium]
MRVAVYSAHRFEQPYLRTAAAERHELVFFEHRLDRTTAQLAAGCRAAMLFANDDGSAPVLEELSHIGIEFLALRSAGYNHVDLTHAHRLGIRVANVPEYSPYAVAEHAVGMILALNRKLMRAYSRVRELNFSLDGLVGFDLHGKTVGVFGVGRIGSVLVRILHGFGCRVLGCDPVKRPELIERYGLEYVSLEQLCHDCRIIVLCAPLTPQTRYVINRDTLAMMQPGIMLINVARGGLLDTRAVIEALKARRIGYLGLDVYEEEAGLFFYDHSEDIITDDLIARLLTFPNVLITSHQAFLTDDALHNIATTSIAALDAWESGSSAPNEL